MGRSTGRGLRLWAVAFLTLAGVLVAGPQAARAAEGGAISGRVTDVYGAPLANECVEVQDTAMYYRQAHTDSSGAYRIPVEVTGDYAVSFGCWSGPYMREVYDDQFQYWSAKRVRVAEGQEAAGIDAALDKGGEVRGRVVDKNGQPLAAAPVHIVSDDGIGSTSAVTGPDGAFTATKVRPGRYLAYSGDTYYGGADWNTAERFLVASGRVRTGVDLQLTSGGGGHGNISGRVLDQHGAPAAGITVAALDGVHPTWAHGWATTDATGSYTMANVAGGTYYVAFNTARNGAYESRFYDGAIHPSTATPVSVQHGTTTAGIDGVLGPGSVVSGAITGPDGEPLANVCINAWPAANDYMTYRGRQTTTGPDGVYRLTGMTEGEYIVHAQPCSQDTDLLPRAYGGDPGQQRTDHGTPVPVDGQASVGGIDIQLVRGGAIEGVATSGGQPLAGLCVSAFLHGPADIPVTWTTTDAAGRYRLERLGTGDHDVAFVACGDQQDVASEWYHDAFRQADATPVAVVAGATTAGIDEDLAPGATIAGAVGTTDASVRVCVTAIRQGVPPDHVGGIVRQDFSATADAAGSYTIRGVAAGHFKVVFDPCTTESGLARQWYDGAEEEAAATVLDVDAGEAFSGIDGVLAPARPRISGLLPESAPVGQTVSIVGRDMKGVTEVRFGAAVSPRHTVMSRRQVDAVVPEGEVGSTVDITLVGPGGVSAVVPAGRFTFEAPPPPPAVTGLSPSEGLVRGGNKVLISGTSLAQATAVSFGSTAASFTVLDDQSIEAVAPAAAGPGPVGVTVTGAGGTSEPVAYTYVPGPRPVIAGLSPDRGPMEGWTSVRITGAHLAGTTSVRFGGQDAPVWGVTDTELFTQAPPSPAAGPADVVVTTLDGSSEPAVFTYEGGPIITGLSPDHGPREGWTWVVISGSGFTGADQVRFGDAASPSFAVYDDGTIGAYSPPSGFSGPVDVVVVTPTGASNPAVFTYDVPPPPVIDGISPDHGPLEGGNEVWISGSNLGSVFRVEFAGNPASFTVLSDWTIRVIPPAMPIPDRYEVVVIGPGGRSNGVVYTYDPPPAQPAVSSITPDEGPLEGGTIVTITGEHLGAVDAVLFGAEPASFSVIDDGAIVAQAPPAAAAGVVDVRVQSEGGTSDPAPGARFEYRGRPVVEGVTPNQGPAAGGNVVEITGQGLDGAFEVAFDSTAATSFTVESPTRILAVVPPGAGTVGVYVRTIGGWSIEPPAYDYVAPPQVFGLSPDRGPAAGGTEVAIHGQDFAEATEVRFGDQAVPFTVVDDRIIMATTPPHASGKVAVTVTNPSGSATLPDAFRYIGAPVVTSVSPSSGSVLGGTVVTVTGVDFDGLQSVALVERRLVSGAETRTPVSATQLPDGSIQFTTPAHAPGYVGIEVVTVFGASDPWAQAARYRYRVL